MRTDSSVIKHAYRERISWRQRIMLAVKLNFKSRLLNMSFKLRRNIDISDKNEIAK